ncbi:MAG: PAS domain S-box protein [bacterium]|nr:PAS domain S-box protein [bacterium]
MTGNYPPDRLRTTAGRPQEWLLPIGAVRIAVLVVVASGTYLIGEEAGSFASYLLAFYVFGFLSALWYLLSLRWSRSAPSSLLTWAQLLVDFGVVAATVSFTGGPDSFFTFLFVVVILEAGLLLGLMQGYVFASLAVGVMLLQVTTADPHSLRPQAGPNQPNIEALTLWYNFVVQALAYYLTASISGYWSQRVRRMAEFQREILDNMNNGFLITDLRGIVTAHNRAAARILGLDEGEAVGWHVTDVLRVESGEECPVLTALRSERDFTRYEFHARTAPGVVKLLGLSTSRAYDSRRHLAYVIASFSDLTELAEMRQEVQRQDRLAVVGELAAGLAHEIRNPVAAIRGAVDELRGHIDTPDLVERLAAIAIRESDHLNRIVGDFLDFARDPKVRRDEFDLVGLVREVADGLQRKYIDCDALAIEARCEEDVCPIRADRTQLKQVFMNLGKNAVEANEMTGSVAIALLPDANSVEVRFDDEGPGVDPDQVARIFEPFYTTKETGVGMGLAVCQRIVTAHDGVIRASQREGGGTSMIVRLPLNQAEE